MNHYTLTQEHKEALLESFQEIVFHQISKGIIPNFKNVKNECLYDTGFQNDHSTLFLDEWFQKVIEIGAIKENLLLEDLNECIMHSNFSAQLDLSTGMESRAIDDLTEKEWEFALHNLANRNGQEWNYKNPFVSFLTTIADRKFRVTLTHPSLSPERGPKAFFRVIRESVFNFSHFGLTETQSHFIRQAVIDKKNIMISGGTGSGKSAFTKMLLNSIPQEEHIVILEDTFELKTNHAHATNLISSCEPGKSMKDFCSYVLRMRPDRIILGEIRSDEIVPYVLAMNNGHNGSLSTIHAGNATDTINRMALLFCLYSQTKEISYSQVLKLVASNIDYVIHLKNKQVAEIIEVYGAEDERILHENCLDSSPIFSVCN